MLMSSISVRNIGLPSAELKVVPVVALHRIFLAKGMALPLVGQEDTAQVGMSLEGNPQEIERLPLVPVGRAPQTGHGGDPLPVRGPNLQVDAQLSGDGEEVVDDLEPLLPLGKIHPAEVGKVVHPEGGLVPEKPPDFQQALLFQEEG